MADNTQTAEEFLTDIPDGWRPEEGDIVLGKVLNLQTAWSDEKEDYYPIIIIDDEVKGPVSVHAFHAALLDRLSKLKPEVGERIGIKMGPKVPLKSNPNRSVQTYTVRVEGRSEQIWDKFPERRRGAAAPVQEELPDAETSDDDIPF